MTIRVLIVDDQALIRRLLTLLLANEPLIEVVGDADNGCNAMAQVELLQPDVVLMDILMPELDGVEATKQISDRFPNVKVLILSIDDDQEYVTQALKYGAAGYILKDTPPEDLAFAIQAVYKGYLHLAPGLGQKIIAQLPHIHTYKGTGLEQLTPREKEIVDYIAKGAKNREIAQALYISEKTVKNHISNILSRLNLRDRTQVAILAMQSNPQI